MNIKSKKIFLVIITLVFGLNLSSKAQMYWVGGSGNWSDSTSWSNSSGGDGGIGVPTLVDEVIFDSNSSNSNFTINFQELALVKKFTFNQSKVITFSSQSSSLLIIAETFSFPDNVINDFKGEVQVFNSTTSRKKIVYSNGEFIDVSKPSFVTDKELKLLAIDSLTFVKQDETCQGFCDGEITITVNGGVGPFTFQWFPNGLNGDGTNQVTDLCPGFYTVSVTDESDNTVSFLPNIQVNGSPPLTILRQSQTNVSCFGGDNGVINTLVFGGNPPYDFSWNDPSSQTTQNATNLSAGSYQLTVSDQSNCTVNSAVWIVTEPPVLTSSVNDSTNLLCFDECNGDATVTASGGTPNYSYLWYDAGNQTTQQATGLCAQTYNVQITDDNGCLDTAQVTLTQPTELVASATSTDLSCNGAGDGTASASAIGGTGAYTYLWYDVPGSPTLPNISGLDPGTYNVQITDANGCRDTAQVVIVEPIVLTSSISDSTNVLCFGECTGTAEVSVVGGTPNFSYLWYDVPSTPTTNSITGLCAGTYNVRVTDLNGCRDTSTVVIEQPALPISIAIVDTIHNLCFEDCDGEIEVLASGGTGPYTYLWYDVAGSPTSLRVTSLCAGFYNVEVTDFNNCKDTLEIEITEPTELTGSLTNTDVLCGGDCDGVSIVTPSGGTEGYTYDWYDLVGGSTDSIVTDLCPGVYNVQITDVNGCLDTITSTITSPDTLEINLNTATNFLCNGECTGAITTNREGGVASYVYNWYDVPLTPSTANVSNLCAGTYHVELTDGNNCKDTLEVDITEPALALISSIIDSIGNNCFGECLGEAEVLASGGTITYSYNWYNAGGQSTPRATNLCAGTYDVQITDLNGCLDTSTVIITEPLAALEISISDSSDLACFGICEGQAVAAYSGGTAPYSLDWYNLGNLTTDTVSNLCAGNYFVEITDNNGCKDTADVNLIEPTQLVTTINSSVLPTCYGDCDGEMSVIPSGGTSPYSFSWYNAAGTPTDSIISNQCSGSYSVAVIDNNGCEDTTTVILSDPDSLIFSIDSQTDVLCKNECTGEVTLNISGGIPTYSISWYDSQNTSTGLTETDLCAGTYNYRVQDNNGCIDTGQVVITEPLIELSSSIIDSTNNLCYGECNGDAEVAGIGGTSPYTFLWYDAGNQTTAIASGLCTQSYNVEVTDFNGCKDSSVVNIESPDSLSFVISSISSSCSGDANGGAKVVVSGGLAPYTYNWYDVAGETIDSVTNVAAGTYHVEVTDANNCVDTAEVIIAEPTAMVATINDSTNISCFGFCDGEVVALGTGGTGPYSYNWYDVIGNPTAPNLTDLCAGTYHVEVIDNNGCIDTVSVNLTEPTQINSVGDSTEATCNGICDASAWVVVSGGVGPYTYDWFDVPGTPTTDSITGLCVGPINVQITDFLGCLDTTTILITSPAVVTSSIADSTNNLCFNSCDGEARVVPVGGVSPYSFNWIDVPGGDTDSIANNLCNGQFTVVVQDANGCQDTSRVNIESADSITVTSTQLQPNCFGEANGEIYISISGGTAPYSIDWYEIGNLTTDTITGLTSGIYNVEITDNNGCIDTASITLTEPTLLSVSITDSTNISCFGLCDGEVTALATGGTGTYSYNWYDLVGTPTAPNLTDICAGIYNVEATDANGCIDTVSVNLTEPTEIIGLGDSTQATCNGICDGSAWVVVSGGVGPYTYDWYDVSGTPTSDSITGLCVGPINVQITDSIGCLDTTTILITSPAVVTSSIADSTNNLCFTSCDGEARVVPVGGVSPYSFNWIDVPGGDTDSIANNLCNGQFTVVVQDANGCQDTSRVNIESPDSILVSATQLSPTCVGDNDGELYISISGGVGPYTINWYEIGNLTTDTITGISAGDYNVEITDNNSCVDTITVTLLDPVPVIATVTDSANMSCFGVCDGEITVLGTGGTGVYTYRWYEIAGIPTSPNLTDLCAGIYNAEVTDGNGCLDTVTITLTQPNVLTSTTDSTLASCFNICDATAKVTASGGTAPYTYLWYDATGTPTTDSITGLCADTFNVQITDTNGCIDTATAITTRPDSLFASIIDSVDATCNGIPTGEAEADGNGGTAPYTYLWYDAPGTPTSKRVTGLLAGTYNVEVTDFNGCSDTATITLGQPDSVLNVFISDSSNLLCFGVCEGQAVVGYNGGTGPYTVNWYNAGNASTDTVSNLCFGDYFAEVTDANGCIDTADVRIIQPTKLVATINSASLPTCFGDCDGIMSVTPSGGTAPYFYNWYSVAGTPTDSLVSGQCSGNYGMVTSDNNGCEDSTLVILSDPDTLIYTVDSQTNNLCKDDCDGSATISITGGIPNYTVNWIDSDNNSSGLTETDLCAGTYNFEVQDQNGCIDTGQVTITEPLLAVSSFISDSTNNLCVGECNGAAEVTGQGGTGPYTFLWYNAENETTSTVSSLCSQIYNVQVTDSNGCLDTAQVNIQSPDSIQIDILTQQPSCNGDSDGELYVSISGGVAPYSIDWYELGNLTTDTLTGFSAGTYNVQVTDSNGCVDTASIILLEPGILVSSIIDSVNIFCSGANTGEAEVGVTGGTGPFNYLWYDVAGLPTTPRIDGLSSGTYHVQVSDVNGCSDTSSVNLIELNPLVFNLDSTQATCVGICDGSASVNVTTGTGPFTYRWYNAPLSPTTDSITNLCVGIYFVEISDVNACLDTGRIEVDAPVTVVATIADSTQNICATDCSAEARVVPSGGVSPYTYNWLNVPGITTDSITNNLCNGIYDVVVQDANGCQDTADVIITSLDSIEVTSTVLQPSCAGDSNGEIYITISGLAPPHTINWYELGGLTTDTITGLTAGIYNVEITNNNGCLDTTSITLGEPDTLKIDVIDTVNVLCFGSATGEIEVLPTGGTAPYFYNWYDVPTLPTTARVDGLFAGTYNVEVTDANGCLDSISITITETPQLLTTTDSLITTCNGVCDGQASVQINSGGTAPFTYNWLTAGVVVNDTLTQACAGIQSVEISDINGCLDTVSVTINQPDSLIASIDTVINNICNQAEEGIAVVSATGGNGGYTYLWDDINNQTNDTASNLVAGNFSVIVTDVQGCTDTATLIISEPDSILLNEVISNVTCADACNGNISTSVTGGTAPYTYSWSTGSNLSAVAGLCEGSYDAFITDANNCRDTFNLSITQPDSLLATASGTNLLCFNDGSGSVSVAVTGGTTPYSYLWNDAGSSTTPLVTDIDAGIYIVEVTDSNNCITTDTIEIIEPLQLISTITDTVQANCVCNGTATVTPSGGTAPYTYLWDDINAQTDSLAINLCASDYSVITSDFNGCLDTTLVTIRDTSEFRISFTDTVLPTCNGVCDGSLTVTPDSGIAPYTFQWTDPLNTTDSIVNGLCAGNYFVTVTDSIGCVRIRNFNLSEPSPIVGTPNFTQPLCTGDSNGIAWVTITGGTAPYTHSWSVGSSNDSITGLKVGSYTDTIRDANLCETIVTVNVTEPTLLTLNPDSIDVSCNGFANGQVWSGVSGGTTPYSYQWDDINNSTTDTVENLGAGLYRIFLVDANGCSDTDSVVINQPTLLTSTISDTTHVNCLCTGTATVAPAGGVAPYTYLWNDINGQTDSIATGLCAGNYFVQVFDANNCVDTSFVTIRDTSGFTASIIDSSMISCNGICNGSATVAASNGTAPYTYLYSDFNGTTDSIVTDLCAGNYFVTVTDDIGCSRVVSFEITEPSELQVSLTATTISCFDSCDGKINSIVTGGTGSYTYSWNDPLNGTLDSLDNVCAGNYTLVVTDSLGCIDSANISLTQPTQLFAFIQSYQDISCNNENDGNITVTQVGGTGPYSYLWSNTATTSTISNLTAGNYSVQVTDANGCIADTNQTIINPDVLQAIISDSTLINCKGQNTGSATVSPIGGTTPYSFNWYDVPGTPTDSVVSSLFAGIYNVEVTDASGCIDSVSVVITEPADSLFFTNVDTNSTSCFVCDGSASITATGGDNNYSYSWINTPIIVTDSFANNLCAGQYIASVTDGNNCTIDTLISITGPGGLTATISDTSMVSCTNACDGMAVAQGIGGVAPYTYVWDDLNATASDTLNDLCPGTYTATITDANGCLAYASITITEPTLLIASISDTSSTSCNTPCTGTAQVSVQGGSGVYTYLWSDLGAQTDSIATGLCAGQYIVTVTDGNGCVDTSLATITGPGGLTATISDTTMVSCTNTCDGMAVAQGIGGVAPYTYVWDDLNTTASDTLKDVCAGTYTATITDANGCLAFATVSITEPSQLLVNITDSINPNCVGDNNGLAVVSYNGGTSPYTVSWNDPLTQVSDTAQNLTAGTYIVTVTDANGCQSSDSVKLQTISPSIIVASITSQTDVSCSGTCSGSANLSVTGGIGAYTYSWSTTTNTTASPTDLCEGDNIFLITDSIGCSTSDTVVIGNTSPITPSITAKNISCNGICDGEITVSVIGGLQPISHSWNNGSTDSSITGLCSGLFVDTIRDASGCFVIDSFRITEPTEISTSISNVSNVSCNGECDGQGTVTVTGGTLPYTYNWTNIPTAGNDSTISNLCSGIYFVSILDSNNCNALDTIVITEPSEITLSLQSKTEPLCYNTCDGGAVINAVGGSGNYSYLWTNGGTSDTLFNACNGSYSVDVTDDSSCVTTFNVGFTAPDTIEINTTDISHVLCEGQATGEITINANGGTGAYSYLWNDAGSSTSATVSNLASGDYIVTVTDANNCIAQDTLTINEDSILQVSLQPINISCNGVCDGEITAIISGGEANYITNWNNGSIGETIQGLCANNYELTVTDNLGCIVVVDTNIIEPATLIAQISDSSNVSCYQDCNGSATVSVTGGTGSYTYLWDDLSAQDSSVATNLCAQTYQVQVTDSNGCVTLANVSLTQPDSLITSISYTAATCSYSTDGSASVIATGGTPSYTYNWYDGDLFSQSGSMITALTTGKYYVDVQDSLGCLVTDSIVVDETYFVLADAGIDRTICEDEEIVLTGRGGVSYTWSTSETTSQITVNPTQTTVYTLTAINNLCIDEDEVTVFVNDKPFAEVTSEQTLILKNSGTVIEGSGAGNGGFYDWNPPIGLSDPTAQSPTASPTQTTKYVLTTTTSEGCTDTASITIRVEETIVFPDGITPNGDGLNDEWRILLLEEFPSSVVEIYNRWGQQVYRNEGYTLRWNGTINGKELPVGTYYYIINLGPNLPSYTGPITLMR